MTRTVAGREPDMTVKQVAEFLNLHPETVRILARQGRFPNAYKTGPGTMGAPIRIPWADARGLPEEAAEGILLGPNVYPTKTTICNESQ